MEKILTLTQCEFNIFRFELANKKFLYVKELLKLSAPKYMVGIKKTVVTKAKPFEVYQDIDNYYIVIKTINQELAFCYSIYST